MIVGDHVEEPKGDGTRTSVELNAAVHGHRIRRVSQSDTPRKEELVGLRGTESEYVESGEEKGTAFGKEEGEAPKIDHGVVEIDLGKVGEYRNFAPDVIGDSHPKVTSSEKFSSRAARP